MNQGQKPPANLQTLSRQQWPEQTWGWLLMFLPHGYTEIPFLHWCFLVFRQNFYSTLVSAPSSTCQVADAGFLSWSAQSPVPAQAVDNSPAQELKAGCVIPATMPTGPEQQQKWADHRLISVCNQGKLNSVWWLVLKGLQKGNWLSQPLSPQLQAHTHLLE